jgi:hypothetical protein
MKRNTMKRLSLNRETLRRLDPQDLRLIHGASVLGSNCLPCVGDPTYTEKTKVVATPNGQGGF